MEGEEEAMKFGHRRSLGILGVAFAMLVFLTSCGGDPVKAKLRFIESGRNYMKKKQYASAAIQFRNTLKIDPRFVEAYYELAKSELAQKHWMTGYASLEKAIELGPNRVDLRLERSRLYLDARKFAQAEEDAKFAVQNDPGNPEAYRLLGGALAGEGKKEGALAAFERVVALQPDVAEGYLDAAVIETGLRREQDAEQHLKKAIELNPRLEKARVDLVNFYRFEKKFAEAHQALEQGIAQNPESVALYISGAELSYGEGHKDAARVTLDELKTRQPKSIDASLAVADFYFRRQDRDAALREYRRCLSLDPKNLELKRRVEAPLLDLDDTATVAGLDAVLMKAQPTDLVVRLNHGRFLLAQGNVQDTVTFLQKLVADAGDSPQAHYFLGLALIRNGNLGQANMQFNEVLQLGWDSAQVLRSLIDVSLSLGNTSAAAGYAQTLVEKSPQSAQAQLLMASVLTAQGKTGPALAALENAQQLDPTNASVHLALARTYFAAQKWSEAEQEFNRTLQLDPHNSETLAQLADYYVDRQQSQKAFARVSAYANTNPNDASGHLILGALNQTMKNYAAAQTELERAIVLDANLVPAYVRLGEVFKTQNRIPEAASQYEKALSLQPKSSTLMLAVGNIYEKQQNWPKAEESLKNALEANPSSAAAANNLAWLYALEGRNLDVALGLAQKAKSLMPANLEISGTLAWVMFKRNNYAEALRILQDCVQKDPGSAQFHYHLGMVLRAAGEEQKGKAQLQAALRMNLSADDAQQARQALGAVN
jgi:tetratricopeptide (TPR) repeat protein